MKIRAALIAEAWGKSEAQFQHPLVGSSGRELTLQMGIAKLTPFMTLKCRKCKLSTRYTDGFCEHCRELVWPNEFDLIDHWKRMRENHGIWIGNVFNEQPPGNDLGHFFGDTKEVLEMPRADWKVSKTLPGGHYHVYDRYMFHIHSLWNNLAKLSPNLVVCMGNASCWAILGQSKITALRGTINWSERLGLKCLPIFHPAATLHNPAMRPANIADFRKASREAEFPEIRRQERWLNILDPAMDSIRFAYEWFKRPARAYAVDIETSRQQITIVGFARAKDDALVVPFRNEDDLGNPNFWPDIEHEMEAWKLVQHGLQTSQEKIFQNGVYDISYFLRQGLHPRNARQDTMLWHHSDFVELPKSLGYLGSIYANEVSWKSMRLNRTLKRDE